MRNIFAFVLAVALLLVQTTFAADSPDDLGSMIRPGPHTPDPMLNTNMPAPPSAISTTSTTPSDISTTSKTPSDISTANMSAPGTISAPPLDPKACEMLVNHTPSADVAYQPGSDMNGKAVAPADLSGAPQMQLPSKIEIPLTVSLAKVLNLNTTTGPFSNLGPGTEGVLGTLTVEGDKAYFNGQPISDQQQDNLAVLCMKQNTK